MNRRQGQIRDGQVGSTRAQVRRSLARRRGAERRFRLYGLLSVVAGLAVVALLFGDLLNKGCGAFSAHQIRLEISFDPSLLGISDANDPRQQADADYRALVDQALRARFPAMTAAVQQRDLQALVSVGAVHRLQQELAEHPDWLGQRQPLWLLASGAADRFLESDDGQRSQSQLTATQRHGLVQLERDGDVRQRLNLALFTHGDSRQAELAGIHGALVGSLLALLVTLCLSLPIGVAAALYLQEFAPRNRWTRLLELNINHLASLPPIVFGLLGLALFIGLFGLPGSLPLLAGLVLALMTLPTIIITSRAAIRAVPLSVRQGALALGASPMQVVLHQVLPLSLPGVLTGAVFSFARALGEAAPLLLIGMLVFVVGVPGSLFDPATVLPVQIYLWASNPDPSFVALAAATTLVLLVLLLVLNVVALVWRRRLEKRW